MTGFATRAVHAGLRARPGLRGRGARHPPGSTYVQRAPGDFVEDYDYSRSANPTRRALEDALGELEGGLASAFASGMAAEHALITAAAGRRPRRDPQRPLRRHLSPGGQGARPLGPRVHDGRPARPRRGGGGAAARDAARLGGDADQPDAARGRHRGAWRRSATRWWRWTTRSPRRCTSARSSWGPTPSCTPRRSTSAGTRTPSAAPWSCATRRCTSACGSSRTPSERCPGRWTASSCTAACARCTCGWRRTPRTRGR